MRRLLNQIAQVKEVLRDPSCFDGNWDSNLIFKKYEVHKSIKGVLREHVLRGEEGMGLSLIGGGFILNNA